MKLIVIFLTFTASIRCGIASNTPQLANFVDNRPNHLFVRFNWPNMISDADNRNKPDIPPGEDFVEQKERRSSLESAQIHPYYDADRDLESSLPYGVETASSRMIRTTRSKTRTHRMSFQSLCPSKRETIYLNLDLEYEYRPDHYEEVVCAGRSVIEEDPYHRPVCSEAGFSCIQLNRTLFLTRRIRGTNCWESETRIVPAGCECMWPKHNLGDIAAHH